MLSGTNSIISSAHILDPKSVVMLGKPPGSGGVKLRGGALVYETVGATTFSAARMSKNTHYTFDKFKAVMIR